MVWPTDNAKQLTKHGLFIPLRVSTADELDGLDITQHEEQGYNF